MKQRCVCHHGQMFHFEFSHARIKIAVHIGSVGVMISKLVIDQVFLPFLVHLCESRRVRVFHMLRNNRTAIVFSKIGVSHFRFGEVSQVGVFSLDLPSIVFHKFRDTDSVGLLSFATKLDYAAVRVW